MEASPIEGAEATRARRRLAVGCAGGTLVAGAASWLRFALEGTLALDTGTAAYVGSALLLGAGLAVAGWCALGLERRAGPLAPAELRWALLLQVAAFPALALTSRDLFSNVAYGELQRLGRSPYLEGPRAVGGALLAQIAPRWADTPSPYGPVVSIVSRVAAAAGAGLSSPVWGGGAAFKLAMAAAALATVLFAYAEARRHDPAEAARRFAILAFSPLLAWEISAQAHNDGLLVLALMVFVWAAGRGRDHVAVAAVTAGALVKIAAAPLLVLYLLLVGRRSPRRAAGLALVATGLAVALVAPYWRGLATLGGLRVATGGGDVQRHAHSLADLLALVLQPVAPRAAAVAYWACWTGSIVLCAAIGIRAALRATSVERVVHGGLSVFLAYCLTTPWFQPWYATWLLPLAVAERDPRTRRIVAVYAVLTAAQWAVPLDPVSTVAVDAWVAVAWWRAGRGPQRSSQDACRLSGAAPVI